MTARVTVAVPTYNGATYLREMLQSIQTQTHEDFRVICIDDASSDDSVAIAESLNVTVQRNPKRLGLAANWNRAIELARDSEYLVIAHQDDVYAPDFLARTAALLDERGEAFIAHTQARYIDHAGRPFDTPASRYKETFWPKGETYERRGHEELRALLRGNYIICPAVMFRREAMEKIGPFNTRYAFVTDWEYWMRGVRAGFAVAGIAQKLLGWRRHDSTATAGEAVSLRRFEEEHSVLQEHGAGDFSALRHTLSDEFLTRLAAGDRASAEAVADCAARHLPWTARAMKLALAGGATGARAVRTGARSWFTVTSTLRRGSRS